MDTAAAVVSIRFHRLLPYWSVLQTDIRQTLQSWIYRLWVAAALAGVCGFFLYRMGVQQEAGLVTSVAAQYAQVLRWLFVGSLAVVVVLGVAAIGNERGAAADAVLSRGISRHQYLLAKMHSRLIVAAGTFALLAALLAVLMHFLGQEGAEGLQLGGVIVAVGGLSLLIAAVAAVGVVIGALGQSAIVGIAVYWLVLYGFGVACLLLPADWPSPERELARLPYIVQGHYDAVFVQRLAAGCLLVGVAATVIGMIGFSRTDV